ncbi:Uncharacterised protein [uncultured archaeon]|nr:Uncharacterised protein [uncultured archaeon]
MRFIFLIALAFLLLGCIAGPPSEKAGHNPSNGTRQADNNSMGPLQGSNPAAANQSHLPVPQLNNSSYSAPANETGNAHLVIGISSPPSANSSSIRIQHPERLQIYYYYLPNCPYCLRISPKLSELELKYGNTTEWHRVDVNTVDGYSLFDSMIRAHNLTSSSKVVPFVTAGGRTFIGIEEINSTLAPALASGYFS